MTSEVIWHQACGSNLYLGDLEMSEDPEHTIKNQQMYKAMRLVLDPLGIFKNSFVLCLTVPFVAHNVELRKLRDAFTLLMFEWQNSKRWSCE